MASPSHPQTNPSRQTDTLATLAATIACSATVVMLALLLLESFAIDSALLPASLLYWGAICAALLALGMAFLVTVRSGQIPQRAYFAIAAALVALLIAGTFMLTVARRIV